MPWIDSFSQLASRQVVAVLHTPWTTDATGFSTCRTYVELEGLGLMEVDYVDPDGPRQITYYDDRSSDELTALDGLPQDDVLAAVLQCESIFSTVLVLKSRTMIFHSDHGPPYDVVGPVVTDAARMAGEDFVDFWSQQPVRLKDLLSR